MSEKILHRVAIILSMVSILAVVLGVKFISGKIDTTAAMQFGGKDNYKLAKELFNSKEYADRQAQFLQSNIDQLKNPQAAAPTDGTTQQPAAQQPSQNEFPGGKLTPDQLAAIKKDAVIEGDKNAKITIVEYSDPECPFCIRHFNDKTIANTVAAYPGSVNHIYKAVQGVNHAGTEFKSLAILCAGKIKGDEAYVGMYNRILANSTLTAVVPNAKIDDYAKELKINTSDLQNCISKGETKSIYAANWEEFKSLAASPGTPGNIVINNETGEWKMISGAYPLDTFKQIVGAWVQ